MKHPRLKSLKVKKRIRLTSIRRLKQEIGEDVEDNFLDIKSYLVNDIIKTLKRRGIVYYAKNKKKNKKKKKR